MKIIVLTDIGSSYAATPVSDPSLNQRILYFMRRHGDKASDEQLQEYVEPNRNELARAIQSLARNKAVAIVGK